jgi:glycosyltransferase involved in cell wall biosynthesis
MKKIIACIKVQNDADIIESFCRYYCSFCDGIVVTDDMSSDNTPDILKSLANEGLPVFITGGEDIDLGLGLLNARYQQYHLAIDRYNADIVLPICADEFLINVNGGNPRPVLESLDETVEYHVRRHNYVCPGKIMDNTVFFPQTTDKYVDLTSPKTIMSRFLFKAKNARAGAGGHSFTYTGAGEPPAVQDLNNLCYNHYPVRGEYQFMLKIILGRIHHLTFPYYDGYYNYTMAWHWKSFYDEIKKHGTVSQEAMERYSVYTSTFIPTDNNSQLTEGKFDTSFCHAKVKLRYTNYDKGKDYFIPILTAQIEKNLLRMPSWRSGMERKVAGEQLGQANATIHNLNAYIETLNRQISPNQIGTFYFDTGNNFNEGEIVHFQHDKKTNHLDIKIDLPKNVQSVRFDPVEGCGCFLQDLVIMSDIGKIVDFQILNGFMSENRGIVFTTTDLQILIDVKNKKIKEITVQCNIWLFS